ncbi:hypothetical protein VJ923_04520 [Adlercreutzia sp. R25]|uniref:hypothetical protein n=1 Tax=Adlercreutzia shanghongiae TaxID=3111773 RepID=UPI002DB67F35|nr:hypothetical protein [Adlercreutzia sp. R25]MEC4272426.1 hypothetical protein [Adlercreutzia sp. R25]
MSEHNEQNTEAPQQPEAPQEPSNALQNTDPNGQLVQDQQRALIEADLKSARTLSTVATIAGPVSFILGGMALSTVALVCGIISFLKVRRLLPVINDSQRNFAMALRQTAILGIVVGAAALIINAIGVALMMPVLLEAMQTGDFSAILGEGATVSQPSNGGNAWG